MHHSYIFNSHYSSTTTGTWDIDQQDLSFFNLVNSVVFIFCSDNTLQESCLDINFDKHLRHAIRITNNVTNHVIRSGELGINFHTYCEQTTWHSIHQIVIISFETTDDTTDFFPACLACSCVTCDVTRSDSYFLPNFQATFKNSTTSNSSFQSLSIFSWLIHIKTSYNNHIRRNIKLSYWDWNSA